MGMTFKDCQILINDVDVSDEAFSVTVNRTKEEVDMTTFGKKTQVGTGNDKDNFQVNLLQGFAGSGIDSILEPLYAGETEFEVQVNPFAGVTTETNPGYRGTVRLTTYPPITATPGGRAEVQLTLPVQDKIVRETT